MCKVQSSICFMCICIISKLITTSKALTLNDGNLEHHQLSQLNTTQEQILEEYISKTRLRSKLKIQLAKMTDDEKAAQSKIVTGYLLEHPLYLSSKRVAIYINTSYEVQTYDIIKNIFDSGKECFIPKYDKHNKMSMVRLNSMEDLKRLPKTKQNIKQPADDDVREDAMDTGGLDLIIVPGLGFTTFGNRLGRGKGYYDRYLTEYTNKFPDNICIRIGLAFTEQICDDIPTKPHDQSVYFVFYPNE